MVAKLVYTCDDVKCGEDKWHDVVLKIERESAVNISEANTFKFYCVVHAIKHLGQANDEMLAGYTYRFRISWEGNIF